MPHKQETDSTVRLSQSLQPFKASHRLSTAFLAVARTLTATARICAIYLIRGYRLVFSAIAGNNCRFYPSCSSYCETAIYRFGLLKGSWMGLKRIGKCHPWHSGGTDLVPDKPVPDKPVPDKKALTESCNKPPSNLETPWTHNA